MVKPARVPKQNKPKKNSTNISAEENALIEEKIEALRSEVDSIQVRSKFRKYFTGKMVKAYIRNVNGPEKCQYQVLHENAVVI